MRTDTAYPYLDLAGDLLYEVVRRPLPTGKTFRQRRPDGNGDWVWDLDGVTPVPYRWPDLQRARDELVECVWVVEGEKDADRLASLGLIATTSAKGAAWQWPADWAEHFRGLERVVVIADNDEPGLTAARQRAAVVASAVKDVRVISRMPDVDAKGDVSDWLDGGGTLDGLHRLAEAAPLFQLVDPVEDEPEVVETQVERLRGKLLTTEELAQVKRPAQLVKGLLALDSLAMLYGPSGVGKSFVAQDFALHIAHGNWWHGRAVKPGPVLYVVAEGAASFGPRLTAWQKHHRLTKEAHPIAWLPQAVNVHDQAWAGALAELVAELRPVLVVLDTFARCIVGAEENSAKDIGVIVANLDRVRRAAGACVMVVHHSGKSEGAGARGSSALRGAMDTELELAGDATFLQMKNPKQKDGPQAAPVGLRLSEVAGTKSVVVTEATAGEGQLTDKVAATLAALMEADVPEGLSTAAWMEVAEVSKASFYRHRSELLDRGLVEDVSETKTPKYRPVTGAKEKVEVERHLDGMLDDLEQM